MKNIKILGLLIIFPMLFIKGNVLLGEENTDKEVVVAKIENGKATSSDPSSSDLSENLIARIVMYLIILAAIGFVFVYFFKQGKFMKGMRNQGNQLKVKETHVLGNKQFLVVVEYGKQKILLGVGPNMINQLCFLESTEDASVINKDNEKRNR